MARCLVTGGAGFVGSHLVDALLAAGHEVDVVDDLSSGSADNLDDARRAAPGRVRLHELSVLDDALTGLVAARRPDLMFHLAAQIDVRHSVADPLHDATVNVLGTIRLLEAARRAGTSKVVLATSGGCVYGEPERLPVREDDGGHAHSPYGAAKLAAEEYLHTYAALYGLRGTSLALGNVYGPRQRPDGEAGVVAIFGGRMLRGEPVTIYGDGTQARDFVFVGDVARAFVAAAGAGDGLRVNIGTARATTVNELHDELAELTGCRERPRHAPPRDGELHRIALDASRASQVLGWRPRTTLRKGLAQTVEWLRGAPVAAGAS